MSNDAILAAQRESLRHDRYKFRAGERVIHRSFGEGVILDFREDGGTIYWKVEFVEDWRPRQMWCGTPELAKGET